MYILCFRWRKLQGIGSQKLLEQRTVISFTPMINGNHQTVHEYTKVYGNISCNTWWTSHVKLITINRSNYCAISFAVQTRAVKNALVTDWDNVALLEVSLWVGGGVTRGPEGLVRLGSGKIGVVTNIIFGFFWEYLYCVKAFKICLTLCVLKFICNYHKSIYCPILCVKTPFIWWNP